MPNIKSQKKRMRTNEKSRQRNRAVKSELKTATRHVKEAVEEGNGADAYAFALAACRLMDKAVSKGVIHKNQAANRKSGIMKLANTIVTDEDRAAYVKPEHKAPAQTGNKKKQARAERKEAKAKEAEEKAKRAAKQQKKDVAAKKKKAKEAEAAAAEAENEEPDAAEVEADVVADEAEDVAVEEEAFEDTEAAAEDAAAEAEADVDAAAEVEEVASEVDEEEPSEE